MNTKEVINHLKTILVCQQFLVTGSYALAKMGLVEESKVGDLDIIVVNPTESTLTILENLQKHQPAKTSMSHNSGFIFMINGIKVDVFVKSELIETELTVDGISVTTVKHIVKEKKKANRLKDWKQLIAISKQICNSNDIQKFLNE